MMAPASVCPPAEPLVNGCKSSGNDVYGNRRGDRSPRTNGFTQQALCAPLGGGSCPATCGGVLELSARRRPTVGHSPQWEGRPVSRGAGPPRAGGRLSLSVTP